MDNASKAILFAGAVLIAIALISLTMMFYNVYRDFNSNVDKMRETEDILNYNRYFTQSSYDVDPTREGVQVYGYDVYNIIMKGFEVMVDGKSSWASDWSFVQFDAWTNDGGVVHGGDSYINPHSLAEWMNYDEFENAFKGYDGETDADGVLNRIKAIYTYEYFLDEQTGAVNRLKFEIAN